MCTPYTLKKNNFRNTTFKKARTIRTKKSEEEVCALSTSNLPPPVQTPRTLEPATERRISLLWGHFFGERESSTTTQYCFSRLLLVHCLHSHDTLQCYFGHVLLLWIYHHYTQRQPNALPTPVHIQHSFKSPTNLTAAVTTIDDAKRR